MTNIERIVCGNGNCFIVSQGNKSVLIDTGREKYKEKILNCCSKYNIGLIILTHGHMDHVQNAAFLSKALNAPIAIAEEDIELLKDNMIQPLYADTFLGKAVLHFSIEAFHKNSMQIITPAIILKEGDTLKDFGINGKIINLKGHTNGSIGIDVDNNDLFVGDALMNMFYPTVSMLYTNKEDMIYSAKRISEMGKRRIHFGHGKSVKNKNWIK